MGLVSATIPAPVGGWNAREPLASMPPQDAIRLVNLFPETTNAKLRKGFTLHVDTSGSRVDSLFEFNNAAGTRQLIGVASNGTVWNLSTAGAPTSLLTGLVDGKWQGVMFRNTLIIVNGNDQPRQYNGTAVSNAAYTGIADDNKLISVDVYKRQLFFIEKDTGSIWYGGTNNITGALTEYDISGILRLGGFPLFAGSWTKDIGSGLNDIFVIVTNVGEVLVFTGDNPGAANWSISGRYQISAPLSRRSFSQYGSDLLILTREGLVPMSEVMRDTRAPVKLTDKIQNAFNEAVRLYSSNFGWEVKWYPRGHYLLVNVPTVENNEAEQYVMNTLTGAWCKFTRHNASTWSLFNEKLYFSNQRGSQIYLADDGFSDATAVIPIDVKGAFNYFGDTFSLKHFMNLRPLLSTDAPITFNLDVDVDYQEVALTSSSIVTGGSGSPWNSSPWNTTPWGSGLAASSDWIAIGQIGKTMAYRMVGSFSNVTFSLNALDVTFMTGGVF